MLVAVETGVVWCGGRRCGLAAVAVVAVAALEVLVGPWWRCWRRW